MTEFEQIVTAVPGPRSRALLDEIAKYEARGVTYIAGDYPVVWESAHGSWSPTLTETATSISPRRSAPGSATPSVSAPSRRRAGSSTAWATPTSTDVARLLGKLARRRATVP